MNERLALAQHNRFSRETGGGGAGGLHDNWQAQGLPPAALSACGARGRAVPTVRPAGKQRDGQIGGPPSRGSATRGPGCVPGPAGKQRDGRAGCKFFCQADVMYFGVINIEYLLMLHGSPFVKGPSVSKRRHE